MGIGPKDSDPTSASGWNWSDAEYNTNFSGAAAASNYEYMATYTSENAGTVAYAFRFKVDSGDWFYCDTDGHHVTNPNEPFSAEALGTITVKPKPVPHVDWCRIVNEPSSVTIENGGTAAFTIILKELQEKLFAPKRQNIYSRRKITGTHWGMK